VGLKSLLETLGVCKSEVRLPLVKASQGLQTKITGLAGAIKK